MASSQPAPVWAGRVDENGRMLLNRREDLVRYVRGLKGQRIELVVRKRGTKRSDRQNRWLWGVAIPVLAEHLGYDQHEHETLHYAMVEKCFGSNWDERLQAHVPNARSSRLTTAEFAQYMEWFVRFAALEFDVQIPLPDESA